MPSQHTRTRAKQFRSFRDQGGWSQAAVARALGVTQATVSNWERGRRPVPTYAGREMRRILARRSADLPDTPTTCNWRDLYLQESVGRFVMHLESCPYCQRAAYEALSMS